MIKFSLYLLLLQDGQKACAEGFGYLVEFDDNMTETDFEQFFEAIIKKFHLRVPNEISIHLSIEDFDFYIGLTDLQKEDIWQWSSSGKTYNMTRNGEKWGAEEPNGDKQEDCAYVKINNKAAYEKYPFAYAQHKIPKLGDVSCETKLTIICQRKAIP